MLEKPEGREAGRRGRDRSWMIFETAKGRTEGRKRKGKGKSLKDEGKKRNEKVIDNVDIIGKEKKGKEKEEVKVKETEG